MAFKLKNIIWGLFGPMETLTDTYKVDNKGLRQRYNETIAQDFDDELLPYISELIQKTTVSRTALLKFLPYLEEMLGGRAFITNDEVTRRRVARFLLRFRQVAGSALGYKMIFNLINIHCTIIEYFDFKSFDIGTFDENKRTFDMDKCNQNCTDYSLLLVGVPNLTPELTQFIENAIALNEPINARLRKWYYLSSDDTDSDGSNEIDHLEMELEVRDESFYQLQDGRIIVHARGGVPPYEYEII